MSNYKTAKPNEGQDKGNKDDREEEDFSSKAQIMNLMTTDVDRVAEFAWHVVAPIDSPIEIHVGTLFLLGQPNVRTVQLPRHIAVPPPNHIAGKIIVRCQRSWHVGTRGSA
ncbi:hypothetical protein FIBSPDRAFT_1041724 [Athelia psychrophila]|uniref:Uncharacterized protein n=1 Tax=Athelia psychrophila TaxID=1759441 RepID=A0A166NE74_9AGAM|nr:hypothetical protein FIBSPDRAFT_1041724 [Fibularhizoctonia sp. CBS 109695]